MNTLDSRIANIDHLLTQDVEKFCTSVADLYTNISKVSVTKIKILLLFSERKLSLSFGSLSFQPFLDIIIYARKLSGSIGPGGPSLLVLYLVFSGLILTRFDSVIVT